jgi:glycosyltransferase involved in cell wall biosynthesis
MRILTISDVYFPRVNGVSTSIQTFRRDLQALGHQVLLIAPQYPTDTDSADPDIVRVPSWQVPRDPEDRYMTRSALGAIWPRIQAFEPDVVHIQTPFVAHYAGLDIARRLGAPTVETYHTYFEHYLQHYVPLVPATLLRRLSRRFTRSQCHQVQALIAPSQPMADVLQEYGVRTPLHVIPTGLDPGRFVAGDGSRFRQVHRIGARPMALFVGRVAHEKNIDFLLRMWQRLIRRIPDALLVIAGEGPALPHIRQQIATLQISANTQLLGYMDRDRELLDCYRAADVFVFASRTETQGLVLLEAMAQGTPVVSTAVMGSAEVLRGAQGARVVAESAEDFSQAVSGVLTDLALREQLSKAALTDAQRWSSLRCAQRLVDLYGTLSAELALHARTGGLAGMEASS